MCPSGEDVKARLGEDHKCMAPLAPHLSRNCQLIIEVFLAQNLCQRSTSIKVGSLSLSLCDRWGLDNLLCSFF